MARIKNQGRKKIQSGATLVSLMLGIIGILLMTDLALAADPIVPKPSAKDKCPVCGMFVTKYPDWTMVVLFNSGSPVFFDGTKDMFKYLFDMRRYDTVRKATDIKAVLVKDYYSLSFVDARKARYVLGSDVYGPMGRELIPMEKEADAQEFMNDHKGKRILMYGEITPDVIKTLDQ
jgi:copper chaperone NosL